MAGGRPTKYREEYCEQLVDFLADGNTYDEFAGHVGVCVDTLHEWESVHPEFSEAKKRARAIGLQWWMKQGREGLWTERETIKEGQSITTKERKLNDRVWALCMKNIYKWSDKVEHKMEGNQEIKLSYDPDK